MITVFSCMREKESERVSEREREREEISERLRMGEERVIEDERSMK